MPVAALTTTVTGVAAGIAAAPTVSSSWDVAGAQAPAAKAKSGVLESCCDSGDDEEATVRAAGPNECPAAL